MSSIDILFLPFTLHESDVCGEMGLGLMPFSRIFQLHHGGGEKELLLHFIVRSALMRHNPILVEKIIMKYFLFIFYLML